MKSILLTISTLFLSNILSANEVITPVNRSNEESFWSSPLIVGALFGMMIVIVLVVVRAAIDVFALYRDIKKASRREAALIKYH